MPESEFGIQDDRPGRFVTDDLVVDIFGDYIGAAGWGVYCLLARYADKAHESWYSQKKLCARLDLSKPTLHKHLKALETCKLISKTHRVSDKGDPDSNLYKILPIHDEEAAWQIKFSLVAEIQERKARRKGRRGMGKT